MNSNKDISNIHSIAPEEIQIPSGWFDGKPPEEFICMKMADSSMQPRFCEDDIILIHLQDEPDCSNQYVVVEHEGVRKLVELIFPHDKSWMLMRFTNPHYPPARLEGEAAKGLKIIGVAHRLFRNLE